MRVEHFLAEKRMFQETEMILKQDYYLLSAMEQLNSYLSVDDKVENNGTFEFKNGVVEYQMIEQTEELLDINITIKLEGNDAVFKGVAIYNRNLNKIINWFEVN
ncbi:competence type IV pilus minor pilin ComGG [Niallia sp. XMNu-256]|uniref:competence type IV pilus minor pilin ComGG n=1 Tax=Niallia sp. XMNu-256 TaxID=3082444 RepID=UPI0030D30DB3